MVDTKWQILSAKVRGAQHIKSNMPCQDAILYHNFMPDGLVCAVADGHGSKLCPYSEDGSRIAVNTAVQIIESMAFYNNSEDLYHLLSQIGSVTLPQQIEKQWKQNVSDFHKYNKRPIPGVNKRDEQQEICRMYGTTLMILVITSKCIYAAQIGDGDMLYVDSNGNVDYVINPDPTYGVETRSLCERKAWRAFKTMCCPVTKEFDGQLFLMSTDGYSNSFVTREDFLKAGKDYYYLLNEEQTADIEKMLPQWLSEASEEGSGDDLTLALLFRRE